MFSCYFWIIGKLVCTLSFSWKSISLFDGKLLVNNLFRVLQNEALKFWLGLRTTFCYLLINEQIWTLIQSPEKSKSKNYFKAQRLVSNGALDIILSIVSQHSLRLPRAIVTNYILHRKTNVDTWINSTAYRTNFITEELKNTLKKAYITSSLVVFIFTWISREYSLEAIKSVANQTSLKFNIFLSILLFCMFSENSQNWTSFFFYDHKFCFKL